ncbi:DUF58 domain-containing protein [Lapillicoccus jejuensis]|uniref:Uncharacterized protein DUF58 n=1 Tax=Lapillicoccus jejuensis TaxID=402171 RepID=A0A542E5L4_9MICO|nr:DUF58 domain-containing protein [Lapillicoccus jejuensis]TQJ10607.1 uncharacterized protein DUF58 [Lapillicoccus jejuensis]
MTALLTKVKSRLFVVAHRKTWGMLDGEYTSVFRGRSLDYDDLREYVPGDEVRDIDWKATARHGSPLVKRYVATRQHQLLLVVDTGRGMAAQAASGEAKWQVAVSAAGLLGYLALRHGDLVGLVEGDAGSTRPHPVKAGEAHLERLLRAVATRTTLESGDSRLVEQLRYVAEHYRRRMLVLVVADDHEVDEEELALVRRLHAQHEILWVGVEDADPTTTARGATAYDVADAAVLPPQLRLDRRLAQAYALAVAERRETLGRTLERLGIVHVRVGSSDAALAAVFRLLERQRRRGR